VDLYALALDDRFTVIDAAEVVCERRRESDFAVKGSGRVISQSRGAGDRKSGSG
jgi:hypothetical protein